MTSQDARNYTENLFKGWDALSVDSVWDATDKFYRFKNETRSYMFESPEYFDKGFNNLIQTWLSDWVGYSEETLFDVSTFSLDEEHVLVSHYRKEVFDFLKKHKIEPILAPFRHKFFWDGGLHCITLDLEREGSCEQYL